MDYEEELIVRKSDAPVKKELLTTSLKSFRVMFLPSFDMGATRKIRKRLPNRSTTKL